VCSPFFQGSGIRSSVVRAFDGSRDSNQRSAFSRQPCSKTRTISNIEHPEGTRILNVGGLYQSAAPQVKVRIQFPCEVLCGAEGDPFDGHVHNGDIDEISQS